MLANSPEQLPFVRLVGDPEENFYRLGMGDKKCYGAVKEQLCSLFSRGGRTILGGMLERAVKSLLPRLAGGGGDFAKYAQAYAAGLGIEMRELSYVLLVPELSAYTGPFPRPSFGCSSYFIWDEELGAPVHGRQLDFPLLGTFDVHERALSYRFDGCPEIFSFGTGGFPFPSLTAMTERGVTFAIHQKKTDIFCFEGTPVFEIVFGLLRHCSDLASAVEYLQNSCSITAWSFSMSFANAEVLVADIMGDELCYRSYRIGPDLPGLYECNFLLDDRLRQKTIYPFGGDVYNSMRREVGLAKLAKLPSRSDTALIRSMGTPLVCRKGGARKFRCDTAAMDALHAVTMAPSASRALFLPGPAPKYYRGEVLCFSDTFGTPRQEREVCPSFRGKARDSWRQGMGCLMLAQSAYNSGEMGELYHRMQMGIGLLRGYPEEKVGMFFFLVFQYLDNPDEKNCSELLSEFCRMEKQLPPYLADHCRLFIGRLEKILERPPSLDAKSIEHGALRELFRLESKWHRFLLRQMTVNFSYPMINSFDILYPYAKKYLERKMAPAAVGT